MTFELFQWLWHSFIIGSDSGFEFRWTTHDQHKKQHRNENENENLNQSKQCQAKQSFSHRRFGAGENLHILHKVF